MKGTAPQDGRQGHLRLVARVPAAASIDEEPRAGWTPLIIAAAAGAVGEVSRILSDDPHAINNRSRGAWTPLMVAAQNGHAAVVELLLANNVQIKAISPDGWTALMVAAQNGHAEVVELLLATSNADVNAADFHGMTALIAAAQAGHARVVEVLLAADAEADAADLWGLTALIAAVRAGHPAVVELLLTKENTNIDIRNSFNQTALDISTRNKEEKLISILENWQYHGVLPSPQPAAHQPQPMLKDDLKTRVKIAKAEAVGKAKANLATLQLSTTYEILVRQGDLLNQALPEEERLRRAEHLLRTIPPASPSRSNLS